MSDYVPAKGLWETVTGKPLPSYAELRARYAKPCPDGCHRIDPHEHTADGGTVSAQVPEVDFHAALRNDSHAWDLKTRLEMILGRPYLATKLVDQLDGETATNLADRLQAIVTGEIDAAVRRVHLEVDRQVEAKMEAIRAERARGVSRERFGRGNPAR